MIITHRLRALQHNLSNLGIEYVDSSFDNFAQGGASGNMSIYYPIMASVGDKAVLIISIATGGTYNIPAGWSLVETHVGSYGTIQIFYQSIADLDTVNLSYSSTLPFGVVGALVVIKNAEQPTNYANVSGTYSMPNPPSLSGITGNSLVLAIGMVNNDQAVTVTSAPIGSKFNVATYYGSTLAIAYKTDPSATEDPAVFGGTSYYSFEAITLEVLNAT